MPRQIERFEHRSPAIADSSALTERQAQVAELMAMGMTTHEIAKSLGISTDTVNSHIDRLKDRFHAFNKVDLICQMWMHGILQARSSLCALVCLMCLLSAFPTARASRPSNSHRRVEITARVGRREQPAFIGELHS